MADLQCAICDYAVAPEGVENELLALLGAGSSAEAGKALLDHMEGHSLGDWIRAFKMADAYIEQLEAQLAAAQAQQWSANPIAVATRDLGPHPSAGFTPSEAWDDPRVPEPEDAELLRRYTPREVAAIKRRRQITQVIEDHDPDETLIPRIPDAQRPEGVVGVKY